MINENYIIAAMTKAGNLLANEMRNKTSGGGYPRGLSSSIVVNPAIKAGEAVYKITVAVKHPAAAAYEFGSGIHATRGTASKYEIRPRNASVLVFPWQPGFVPYGSRKFSGVILNNPDSTEGTYFFHFVEHPGVEARPYAIPSYHAKKSEIFKLLGSAFTASISLHGGRYEEKI